MIRARRAGALCRIATLSLGVVWGSVATAWPSAAQSTGHALVVTLEGRTFPQVVGDAAMRDLAAGGGIAMLRGPGDPTALAAALRVSDAVTVVAASDAPEVATIVETEGEGAAIVVVVVTAPADPGLPDSVLLTAAPGQGAHGGTLTSDSTRRLGIVTPDDVAATVAAAIDDPSIDMGVGAPIEVVDAPPPVELHERYAAYRELSAPVQGIVAGWEVILGAASLLAIRTGRWRRLALGAVLSLPGLFLALLLVGHLPRPSFATVLPVLAAVSVAGGVSLLRLADREGIGTALAWAGGIALGGLVVESLVGWTAAFAPMLGGSHLDGARFFGMPNAEIGLAVGGALLVAHRLRSGASGLAVLAATALWAGAPWFGANLGAAVTAGAAAGGWWAIRRGRGWVGTSLATVGGGGTGGLAAIGLNRLDPRPTHISRATDDASVGGVLDDLGRRLEIGTRLIADQPAAAIPVVGTAVGLALLARPPRALTRGFDRAPGTRDAALAIGISSVVAYLANDTGAAALGLGFGLLAVTMIGVSLAPDPEKMAR